MFGLEMNSFNVDDGFAEATVRALSKSILKKEKYDELIQCSKLDEFKLVLDETDYGKYILNTDNTWDVNWLRKRMTQKLKDEIEYIMINASNPLSQFLEKMMHQYQIENVVTIVNAYKQKNANIDDKDMAAQVKQGLNPLGEFNFDDLKSVFGAEDLVQLFNDVLIDLPVSEYFRKFIDSVIDHKKMKDGVAGGEEDMMQAIIKTIEDYNANDLKIFLKKIWLISFHRWVMQECNGGTQAEMDELLKCESDWETLQILYNSLSSKDGQSGSGKSIKEKYFNSLGHLYPGRTKKLNEAKEFNDLKSKLENTEYREYFEKIPDPVQHEGEPELSQDSTIDDVQKRDLSRRYSMAYMGQFHYGVFYAFLRLKEMEIQNICHLADLFSIEVIAANKNAPAWKKCVAPFQYDVKHGDQDN